MKFSFSRHLFTFCILLIFLFSFVSKIYNLGTASFDFDEIYSVKTTWSPYWKIITGIKYDPGNPPLYFVILKAWKTLVGENEFRLRLLSVIFHIIALATIYFQSKKHLTKTSTLIVMMLFAASRLVFVYARYTRAYSLLLLTTTAVFPLFVEFVSKNKFTWPKIIVLCLLCLVGLYSHYSFVMYYIFLFLTLLFICRSSKRKLKRLFSFTYFVCLAYLPWAVYFFINQVRPLRWWMKYKFGQVQKEWVGFDGWFAVFTNDLSKSLPLVKLQVIFFILTLLIFNYFLVKVYKKENNLWKKSTLLFFFLSLNTIVFTPLHKVLNDPRYSIYILPFAFLGLSILIDSSKKWLIKYAVFIFLIPYSIPTYSFSIMPVFEDYKSLTKRIPLYEQNSVLLFHPCYFAFSFDYYYKGQLPQYCFFENPEGMYLKIWDKKPQETLYIISKPWKIANNKLLDELIKKHSYSMEKEIFGDIELTTLKR